MEQVKEYLKGIGHTSDEIELLLSDEKPEGFSLSSLAESYNKRRAELTLTKSREDVGKAYMKDEYPKIVGSIKNKIKNAFGLSNADISDRKLEDVLSFVAEKHGADLQSARSSTSEDYVTQIDQWKAKYNDLQGSMFDLEKTKEQAIAEANKRADEKILQLDVLSHKSRAYSGIEFSDHIGKQNAIDIVDKVLSENYKLGMGGKIFAPDGSKAVSLDGNRFYDTIDDAVADITNQRNLIKRSNGGQQPQSGIVQGRQQELSAAAKSMLERAAKARG